MNFRMSVLAALAAMSVFSAFAAEAASDGLRFSGLKAGDAAGMQRALMSPNAASAKAGIHVRAPVGGDVCTPPDGTSINPFAISSTTVGATNNYDISTTCGVPQTLFGGTGAAPEVAFGVVTDADCSVTVSADPTGTSWDLALFVLQAPAAACTQLPSLANAQCVTMDDDGGGNVTENVTWAATANTEYYVIVDGFNSATGPFDLTITGTGCNLIGVPGNADLSIAKTDGVTTATPGGSVTYTITASNAGPDPVDDATVSDIFPITETCTWTCAGAGGGTCTAAGSGNIGDSVDLPVGGSVTYTASCAISPGATGTLSNTATVAAPAGVIDPTPGNDSALDEDTLAPEANLGITKTDGVAAVTAGGSTTYTITASNAGPSDAPGATVADTFPADLTCTWTCVGAGGGTCTAAGSGNISDTANLPAGGSTTYTASCTVSATATGMLSNTATVAAPAGVTDPVPGNDFATDEDSVTPQADLSITKTDGVTSVAAGSSTTYTITASNAGPGGATGATVSDTFPAGLTCNWTCIGAGSGTCTAAGSGNIGDTVNLPAGGSVTYSAVCAIDPGATGTLDNTATVEAPGSVSDTNTGNNSATDSDIVTAIEADLSITKDDGVASVTAGGTLTYTIAATNAGPSGITGATVADTLPADLTCTWTCAGTGGGTCTGAGSGNIGDTVDLPVSATVTYTASCTVADGATGPIANTATITAPAGATEIDTANNTATDTDTVTAAEADLSIIKTDGVDSVSPGDTLTYTIVASNAGPNTATGATVTDTFPADLTCTWTCAGSDGGTCTAGGSGNLADNANLPSGASVVYTAVCDVSDTATGPIVNTATVAAPAGVSDPDTADNSATDTDTVDAIEADLSITKTDGVTSTSAGGTLTYTLVASNAGPSVATGATVSDNFPADLTCTWTCAGGGSGSCGAGGTGDIADTVNLPPGGTATYTAVCDVSDTATGSIVNTATIAPPADVDDPAMGNNSATDTDTVADTADLSITKTDNATTVNPGQTLTYAIVASNSGPQAANDASVGDAFPAACDTVTWTCAGSGGGTCTASGSGDIADTVDLPASASVTYTATCTIDAATADGTVVSNTATVALAGGTPDPVPGNDSATDTTTVLGAPDVSGSKTVAGDFTPGGTITYTIVLSNDGNAAQPDNAGDEFSDPLPAGLSYVDATATGGTVSFAAGSVGWNGGIPAGGSVTITIEATIDDDADGIINNQGTVHFDADNNGSNEASVATDDPGETGDANPTGFEVDGGTVEPPPSAMPAVIPATGTLPLIALALLLMGFALRRRAD